MKQAILYSLKVWLTTILVTPALRLLIALVFNLPTVQTSLNYGEYYLMAIYMGFVFSIPGAIALWIFTLMLNRRPVTLSKKKLYLSIFVFVETMLTFYLVFWLPAHLKDNIIMTLPYMIISTAAIWFYKLKPVEIMVL